MTDQDPPNPSHLDPQDWGEARRAAHALLDACLDRMTQAADHAWTPMTPDDRAALALSDLGRGDAALAEDLARHVLPHGLGNTHPRFFGWVMGAGHLAGLMAEMTAATINANCGGWDHAQIEIEAQLMNWCRDIFGFGPEAGGLLVTGTSQATLYAVAAARLRALGDEIRAKGQGGAPLRGYAGASSHGCLAQAFELLGLGRDALRLVPETETETDTGPDLTVLAQMIAQDRADGALPFFLGGTAGRVQTGGFDDLSAMADFARQESLWFHVDGAFGAWTRLADAPWRDLSAGIERADSLACDFHKWISVPYAAGLLLLQDEALLRRCFAGRESYLAPASQGLAAAGNWPADLGFDLSRGPMALKIWAALKAYGPERLGAAISENCRLAALMGQEVAARAPMALARPVRSNICVFTADARLAPAAQSQLNQQISEALQLSGQAVFSTVALDGQIWLRAAVTNHRTKAEDVRAALQAVAHAAQTAKI
ncbi:MAG: pyridoxal phosphate-dependent decarboxylase family protein [Mangrovicoccus sp.]